MDFAVSVESASARVVEGASVALAVTIERNEFEDSIAVTVEGLPAGVTADPLMIEGRTGTLMLRAAAGATQGEVALRLNAQSNGRSHDLDLKLLTMGLPGTADRSFGVAGSVVLPPSGRGAAVAVQPDGKVVVVGTVQQTSSDLFVARYLADGALDATFAGGVVTFGTAETEDVAAVALQADGKLVVVGTVTSASGVFGRLWRLTSSGALDGDFAGGGGLTLKLNDLNPRGAPEFTALDAVAIQSDGGIVVAGATQVTQSTVGAVVARITPRGTVDVGFGVGGRNQVSFGTAHDHFRGLTIQADGRLVAVGEGDLGALSVFARFSPTGQLDVAFDHDGKAAISSGTTAARLAAVVELDGKLLAGGSCDGANGERNACLVRLHREDGSVDSSFTAGVFKLLSFNAEVSGTFATGVTLQRDGKVVLCGRIYNKTKDDVRFNFDAVVARLSGAGLLDATFAGGIVARSFSGNPAAGTSHFQAVSLDEHGRIVATGFTYARGSNFAAPRPLDVDDKLVVARFWP